MIFLSEVKLTENHGEIRNNLYLICLFIMKNSENLVEIFYEIGYNIFRRNEDIMIKVTLSNEILKYITEIDKNRYNVSSVKLSPNIANKLRKNSKKKSSYASNKIEGNPLTENQVDEIIENDERKHFLKPEQEVRNYFLALNYLEEKAKIKEPFSKKLILRRRTTEHEKDSSRVGAAAGGAHGFRPDDDGICRNRFCADH